MNNLLNVIGMVPDIEEYAVKQHIPQYNAVYIMIDCDMQPHVISYNELVNSQELKMRDYYSSLISMNKSVDPKKIIRSNNKYTLFVKSLDKLTDERLQLYYDHLEITDDHDCKIYKQWVLDHMEYLNTVANGKMIKLFFTASIDQYISEGKRYFSSRVFSNRSNLMLFKGEVVGSPLTINMNKKKSYEFNTTIKVKCNGNPSIVTKNQAYLIKYFLDILMSKSKQNYDKLYISENELYFVEKGKLFDSKCFSGQYLHFLLDQKCSVIIDDWLTIPQFALGKKNVNDKYCYTVINSAFFRGGLYEYLTCTEVGINNYVSGGHDLLILADQLKKWFIIGNEINASSYRIIRKLFVKIVKFDLGSDVENDIQRLYFIKYLDDIFK